MYDPKYDLPLAIGLSLVVSLTVTYVTAKISVKPPRIVEGALLPRSDGKLMNPSPSLKEPASIEPNSIKPNQENSDIDQISS